MHSMKIHHSRVSCIIDVSPVVFKHSENKLRSAINHYGIFTLIELVYDGYLLHRMDYSLEKAATVCIIDDAPDTFKFVDLFIDLIACFSVLPSWNQFRITDAFFNYELSNSVNKAELCFDADTENVYAI